MLFIARALIFVFFVASALRGGVQVTLTSSVTSPQPLGTKVTWTATASDTAPGPLTYKWEVALNAGAFALLRDFNTVSTLNWVPRAAEGTYSIRVTARDYLAGFTGQATQQFQATSLLVNNQATVNATAHPLVALFSAPTCPTGSTMRIAFNRAGASAVSYTDYRACHAGSMNFYIGGMLSSTTYNLNYQVLTNGVTTSGPVQLNFTTGAIPSNVQLPAPTILVPPTAASYLQYKLNLFGFAPPRPFASDLTGAVVWYSAFPNMQLLRALPGGTFLLNGTGAGTGTGPFGNSTRQQILREIDLAGNVLRETNADRVSEQLVAVGSDPIDRFNHDAIRLPNGNTLALADSQRIFPAGTQGSSQPIDIIGEQILLLDQNFQLLWHWNAFDHAGGGTQLDINRAAVRGEVCVIQRNGTTQLGCPPVLLLPSAADWLHANSVQVLNDGNIALSLRDQDWVVKIDYQNGSGTGNILWRLGPSGDFSISGGDPVYPWFSGQHDAGFEDGATLMTVFDNGNTRVALQGSGHSRGMVVTINESTKAATVTLSADLGVFSPSQGSAQLLPNGNYAFQPGNILPLSNTSTQSIEIVPSSLQTAFQIQYLGESYRCFRMPDLYTPPGT